MKNLLKKIVSATACGTAAVLISLDGATPAQAYTLKACNDNGSDRLLAVNSYRNGTGKTTYIQNGKCYTGDISSVSVPAGCYVRYAGLTVSSSSGRQFWHEVFKDYTGTSEWFYIDC